MAGPRKASHSLCLLPPLAFCVLLVALAGLACGSAEAEIVTFADPNLEAAVREAIDKRAGDIYRSDVEGLASLDASGREIGDLRGLEYLTSLTHLYLIDNGITNISVLANLTGLTELYLGWNQISDISPLAGLANLTALDLASNLITDVSALSGLSGLRQLYLDANRISDIAPLAGLTELRELYLYSNQISDISALAGLTNLRTLSLGENQIGDISPLVVNVGLGEGDYVDLANNPLSEVSRNTYIPQLQARGVTVLY